MKPPDKFVVFTHQLQSSKESFWEQSVIAVAAAIAAAAYYSPDSVLFSEGQDPDDPEPELDSFEIQRIAYVAVEFAEQLVRVRGPSDWVETPREDTGEAL